jgi:hypothetical protein
MRKSVLGIIIAIIGAVLLGAGILALSGSDSGLEWKSDWKQRIRCEAGQPNTPSSEGNFTISKSGKYTISIRWQPEDIKVKDVTAKDIGFVTSCKVTDEQGETVYSTLGLASDTYMTTDLAAGNYHMEFSYFADRETYPDLAENGTWQIDYRLSVNYVRPFSTRDICAVFSILLGTAILLILTVSLYRKQQVSGTRYDERQEVEQGRAFRYAFYAAMVTVGVSLIIDSMGIFADGMSSVFYAASIFIGLMVYVIYGYWHDCYIALNEKKGFTITFLLIIGVINLAIGLSSLNRDGWLDETGHMNTTDLNFLCGATAIILVVAGLIRFVTEKISAKDDGGDDE